MDRKRITKRPETFMARSYEKLKSNIKAARERKTRLALRSANNFEDYEKRKMTTDTVRHFILFPVVLSTLGKNNDFFYHVLSLCWNDKNISKDVRCQQLLRGLRLDEAIKDFNNLIKSKETGWFSSSRNGDLEKIGKVAGYFVRTFASSVAKALDDNFIPELHSPIADKSFTEFVHALKDNKTIIPVIVQLEISSESAFDESRFVCLPENYMNSLVNGDKVIVTRRVTLLKIANRLHDWAWNLLSLSTFDERQQFLNNGIPTPDNKKPQLQLQALHQTLPRLSNAAPIPDNEKLQLKPPSLKQGLPQPSCVAPCNEKPKPQTSIQLISRKNSTRLKQRSKRYPSSEFVTN